MCIICFVLLHNEQQLVKMTTVHVGGLRVQLISKNFEDGNVSHGRFQPDHEDAFGA
jgi:hypothetical protein